MACILLERGTIPLPQSGMVLGVLVGLNILVRWTSVVLAILPVGLFLWYGVDALKRRDSRQLRILAGQSILGVLSGLMILAPQLALWERLYNQWVSFPTRGFSDQLLPPNILKLYVSTNRGILFWSPFLVVGLVGLIRFPYRKLRLLFLLYLLAFSILLGRWGDWYGGGGYGTRYFIEIVPIAAVGFVALLRGMSDQWSAKVGAGFLACLLIMHQLILLVTVEHGSDGWIPLDTYGKGEQLGIMIQVENSMRLLEYPLTLLQPRPFVALERQSLLVNYLAGHRDLKVFAFSLTALLIIPLGVVAVYALQKQRGTKLLRDVALIMLIYMTGWFIYVLYV